MRLALTRLSLILVLAVSVVLALCFAGRLVAQVPVRKDAPRGAVARAPFRCVVPVRTAAPSGVDSLFAAMLRTSADTLRRDKTAPTYAKVATACVDSLARALIRWTAAPPPPVNQAPVARYTVACTATECVLDASSSSDDKGVVTYAWTSNSAARPPQTGVRITRFAGREAPSTWQETLTVTDAAGLTNATTKTITIASAPPPPPDTVVTPPPPPPDTVVTPPPDTTTIPPPPPAAGVALPSYTPAAARPPTSNTARTIRVAAGGNLQAAIDTARRGDVILLAPGATYAGNYVCKAKPGTGWVTIGTDGASPVLGVRATPADAPAMARVFSGNSAPAFECGQGVRGYRFEALNIECSNAGPPAINYNCIAFGDTHATTTAAQGGNFVVASSWVHGSSTTNMQRCIGLNSDTTAVVDSWISDCHAAGFDSQAIAGWNGPGPYLIENNYLEGAGENVMFGGADPDIPGLIPSDITIRNNHFFKPFGIKGRFTVKNLFELKNSRRTLVENNVFENNWADAQQGFAILFKSVNQDNRATWSQTADLTFRNNVVRCSPSGLTVLAVEFYPAQPASRVSVTGNFFDEIGSCNGTSAGRQNMLLGGVLGVEVSRNTYRNNAGRIGAFLILDNAAGAQRLVVRDNVSTAAGIYDAEFMNGAGGLAALTAFSSSWTYTGNVIGGLDPGLVFRAPPGNSYPATVTVGANGATSLAGKGADAATIASVIAKAVIPWPANAPRTMPRGAAPSDWWQRACAARGEARPVGGDRNALDPCAARGLRRTPR